MNGYCPGSLRAFFLMIPCVVPDDCIAKTYHHLQLTPYNTWQSLNSMFVLQENVRVNSEKCCFKTEWGNSTISTLRNVYKVFNVRNDKEQKDSSGLVLLRYWIRVPVVTMLVVNLGFASD